MNLFIAGTDAACALISLVVLYAILSTKVKKKKKNIYLILGIISLVIFSTADAVSFVMDEIGGNDLISFYSNLLSYLGADIIVVAFVFYISERIREKCDFSKAFSGVVFVGAIFDVLIMLFGAYTGALYRIENGQTVYGALNDYLGIVQFVVVLFFLTGVVINRKHLEKKFFITVCLYFLSPIAAMVLLFIDDRLIFTYLAAAISFLIIYVVVVQEDLQASILEEKMMHKASITDALTGLLNRRAYTDDIKSLSNSYPNGFVYMSLDVNGLKNVNDHLGHAAGDEIITGAARCMTKCLGLYGSVYRTGGDEFTAIVCIPPKKLQTVLNEFELEVANWHGKLVDSLSVSYGYVKAEETRGCSIDKVSVIADERMYKAKADFYKKKGIDRRGREVANTALCNLYTKVLKINLTSDTYSVVSMDVSEQTAEKGFTDSISDWLQGFGKSGQVHEDDLDEYLKKTEITYLKEYFRSGKTSISISYRRKYADGFKHAAMEMIPADDYEANNQTLFLYVKNIDI